MQLKQVVQAKLAEIDQRLVLGCSSHLRGPVSEVLQWAPRGVLYVIVIARLVV